MRCVLPERSTRPFPVVALARPFVCTACSPVGASARLAAGADPDDVVEMRAELEARITFCRGGEERRLGDAIEFDATGRPVNPVGRTGLAGRGLLGKWGPNHAADPIVTRFHPETGVLQVVAIQRKDTLQWALPGGMVDPGEAVSLTVRREFEEEAGEIEDQREKESFINMCDELFKNGSQVHAAGRHPRQGSGRTHPSPCAAVCALACTLAATLRRRRATSVGAASDV